MDDENRAGQIVEVQSAWADQIPDEQWGVYRKVIEGASHKGLRFALGGAFAVATYTGRWRNTKDLDFYVLPPDRDTMVEVVDETGLQDYYEKLPYQRHWIYRSYQDNVIVDIIWAMANGRDLVDDGWLSRGPVIDARGQQLHIVPPEEMICGKVYVMQKDRCDWPDIFNILYAVGPSMDWEHLLSRLGSETPLIGAVLNVFAWLCPSRARELPKWLWKTLSLHRPGKDSSYDLMRQRAAMLDTRPWFLPLLET